MSTKEILDLEDESIERAAFMPDSSRLAVKLFNIMMNTVDSCYITAGMSGAIMSIDQNKMEVMAERRGVDLARYDKSVRKFTSMLLNTMNSKD